VVAVDLSSQMLEQAQAATSDPRITFVNADISQFDPGERFDRIVSVRVLEYVPEWETVISRFGRLLNPGGRAVVITKTPVSVWRGTGRERWFGPRTFARTVTGRTLNADFWQRHISIRALRAAFITAGLEDVVVRPVIVGLPVYMRGTKQYPLIPPMAEPPLLRASEALWRWASAHGPVARATVLPFSESYAVSGRRPH
jgi:ubiquinone/menaquinone biosynthesis C-methylase UbiE